MVFETSICLVSFLKFLNLKFCHITSEEYELCALSRLLPHNKPGLKEGYRPHTYMES